MLWVVDRTSSMACWEENEKKGNTFGRWFGLLIEQVPWLVGKRMKRKEILLEESEKKPAAKEKLNEKKYISLVCQSTNAFAEGFDFVHSWGCTSRPPVAH